MNVDLTEPWDLADVIFVIEDKKLYVNKTILMMSSEVFRTMFTADFREKDLAEIPLPGKKFDVFLMLMKVIHPPHMEVNGTNVQQLLPLSHEYGVHHVTSCCEKVLLTEPPSVQNLVLADRYSLLRLREACLTYTQHTRLTQLEAQPGFDELQAETKVDVLRHKVVQMELEQKPEDANKPEEEEAELTKEFLCELMSKPPSVQNLVLAEKYDIPQLKEICIQYAKNKPLSALKAEPGYDKITPATLVQILDSKVVDMEPKIKHLRVFEPKVKEMEPKLKLMEPKVLKFDELVPELKKLSDTVRDLGKTYGSGETFDGLCHLLVGNVQHKLGEKSSYHGYCLACRRYVLDRLFNTSLKALQGIRDIYIRQPSR